MKDVGAKNNRFYLSRKLIGVVIAFIIAASVLVVLTNFSINMIAASTDYLTILSKWSQHHYQADVSIERFGRNGDQEDYDEFIALQQEQEQFEYAVDQLFNPEPDVQLIFEAFPSDIVSPNEISSLLFAFKQFRAFDQVNSIKQQWAKLKEIEGKQLGIAEDLYEAVNTKTPVEERVNQSLQQYARLNKQWIAHNQQLMAEVGSASVIIKRTGLWISVILGILLVLIGVVFAVRARKSINRWEHALNEKEVLLSEVHHRVKNNMAVVSSLLELENMRGRNAEQALQDSKDRIQSMAMIHEELYQSDSFSRIDLSHYLQSLSRYIIDAHSKAETAVILNNSFDEVTLNINQAVPVGLIVNEVLANVVDYMCEYSAEAEITVRLTEKDSQVVLSIEHNGNGKSDMFNLTSAEAPGTMIVNTLAQQLKGEIVFNNGNGLTFELQFQKSDAAGSSNAFL